MNEEPNAGAIITIDQPFVPKPVIDIDAKLVALLESDPEKLQFALTFIKAIKEGTTKEFIEKQPDKISGSQIIAIAKMICAVASVVCPIVNDL